MGDIIWGGKCIVNYIHFIPIHRVKITRSLQLFEELCISDIVIQVSNRKRSIEESLEGAEGALSALAAMASSRDTVELSWKNMLRVNKTISGEKSFAFVAIGKRL